MTHHDVLLERLTTEIEETVLETEFFVYLCFISDLERRCLSLCKDTSVSYDDLDVSCLKIRVLA